MLSIPPQLLPFGTPIEPLKTAFFETIRLTHWRMADAHAMLA
jgi:hypothetical protein